MAISEEKFQITLDETHEFPCNYNFKFIVPIDKREDLLNHFPTHERIEKASKNGKFQSFTIKVSVTSGSEIVSIYRKVSMIEGVISL